MTIVPHVSTGRRTIISLLCQDELRSHRHNHLSPRKPCYDSGRVHSCERGRKGLSRLRSEFAYGLGVRLRPGTSNFKRERINVISSLQEIVLTSVEQYRSEVLRLPQLTRQEERELVQRARQGDQQAKEILLQSCLRYVASVAYRYVCYMQHDEYLDLVSVAKLALVECLEKALTIDNPVAYLLGVAKLAVKAYCCKHSGLMTRQRGQPFVWVDSLDTPLGNGQGCLAEMLSAPTQKPQQETADFSRLYQAISALTPKQRYVILRHFGLDGTPPNSSHQ